MRYTIISCLLIVLVGLMSGCGKPDIIVADSAGKPIKGAIVTGTSLSINGGQTMQTDRNGFASIPWGVQNTQWISVAKSGYVTVSNIDVNQKKPIEIVLKNADTQ